MKVNPLLKDLIRSCWLLAAIVAAIAFMFVSIFKSANTFPVLYSLFVGFRTLIQGLANIFILVTLQKLMPTASSKRKKLIRYAIRQTFLREKLIFPTW